MPSQNMIEWAKQRDTMERVDCAISRAEFARRYVEPRRPVMLVGCIDEEWRARNEWLRLERFVERFDNATLFRAEKVGVHGHEMRPLGELIDEISVGCEKTYIFDQVGLTMFVLCVCKTIVMLFFCLMQLLEADQQEIVKDYRVPHMFRVPHDVYKKARQQWQFPDGYGPIRWLVVGNIGTGTGWVIVRVSLNRCIVIYRYCYV
jgi:hypothetical protein